MNPHPRTDDQGKSVTIRHPSEPTPLECWSDPAAVATVIPDGQMPAELNGIALAPWQPPATDAEWAAVAGQADIDEPPFSAPSGKNPAAGVVVIEPDGRIWLVSPSNGYGGYKNTFPKGRPEADTSLQATAICEAFEESGLKVEITGFLADLPRSTTRTRYYTARRVGGTPAAMGWESQAVHLVPRSRLAEFLTNGNDAPLLKALTTPKPAPTREDLLKYFTLSSAHRIVYIINAYRQRFGKWPSKVTMDAGMYEALQREIFTPLGWSMMAERLELLPNAEGTVIAFGSDGSAVDYADIADRMPPNEYRSDVWIWGIPLAD
jgi:ADP-ribose pyrophosphatase YjhB (NUDIX family)